ncbi:hypothetical protein [Amycolatopsis sp. H20-H5]|uniref:hypothetical protein n=1 Tax=Amycolatopsis sp. H20-H5 TaxID=3046309 RepID=UPI002DBE24D0|nr:hypothetical protein [Amycolatopsis sp. H20-H5]MEC3977906.1 hypothetical protein [Amycolatopsis sp. H20-H5]
MSAPIASGQLPESYRPPMPPPELEDVDHDFDAAWAERRRKGKRVRIRGNVYELPASVPAKVILFAAKAKRTGADLAKQVDPVEIIDLLSSLLGTENIGQLLADGLDFDEMGDVMGYCMASYRTDVAPGEEQAPAVGPAPTTPSA